ncbi:MAG: polymer-forming cytoskeletal protein [Lysobacterales bacterium]
MFGDKKSSSKSIPAGAIECLVGERMNIVGDVRFAGSFIVEGRIKGTVIAEESGDAVLKLYERGQIEGQVQVPQAEIHGEMLGDVVSEKLILGATARVRGNLYYRVLEMAAGAQVNGQMVHQEEPRKQLSGPEPEAS